MDQPTPKVTGRDASPFARAARFLRSLRSPDRLVALLEQGLLATIRLVGMVVFARIMEPSAFGAFALVVSVSFVLDNLQRSLVVLPFMVSCPRPEDVQRDGSHWVWLDILVTTATTLLLFAVWGTATALDLAWWVRTMLFYSALGAPPLMAYNFLRRWQYQLQSHRSVVVMVFCYAASYALGIAATVLFRDLEALPFLTFALAPLVAFVVGLAGRRRSFSLPTADAPKHWRRVGSLQGWTFLSTLCGMTYSHTMNVIIAGFVGAVGSAAFSATRALVAPIVSLTSATDMIDKPRAGRAFRNNGIAGLRSSIRRTIATLVLLGTPYLAFVFAFSEPLLEIVYGTKYAHLGVELRLWAAAMFFQMLANPLSTHLIMLANPRRVFVCNLWGAALTLAVAVPLFGTIGITAALTGMIAGRSLNVLLLYLAFRRGGPRHLPQAANLPSSA